MQCKEVQGLLPEYLETIKARKRLYSPLIEVNLHVNDCSACTAEFIELIEWSQAVRNMEKKIIQDAKNATKAGLTRGRDIIPPGTFDDTLVRE